jgi:hypothetical protein
MRLKLRVARLVKVAGQPGRVTWEDAMAAHQRFGEGAIAKIEAFLEGRPMPERDADEAARDSEIIARWEKQQGIVKEPEEVVKARLLERLERLGSRPNLIEDMRRVNRERFER